ncbi:MAG: GMC family oxidoreductase [Gammaproteobacteria bacterium]
MAKIFAKNDDRVVVVIGSGAGGATISSELTAAGIDVVCLEAGSPVDSIVTDASKMFGKLTWFDKRMGSGDLNPEFPVWTGKNVGGTTLHWTASTPRIPQEQFTPSRYFSGLDNCSVMDWPFPYSEAEYYYSMAEKKMGVSGTHGWPKLPPNNNFKVMQAGAKNIGIQDVEMGEMAINSVAQGGRPACRQLGFCVSGCAINAKWTAANTPLVQAQQTDHFELRPQSFVLRIEHDDKGQASAVVYVDKHGTLQRQKARLVCLAANSIDTPRILFNSETSRFPNGLANKSGHVGLHYTKHVFSVINAIMPKKVHFYRGAQNTGTIRDFVKNNEKRAYRGGFKYELVAFDPTALVHIGSPGAWGKDYADKLGKYDQFAAMLVNGEDPSQESNRVTMHPTEKDQYGMPVPVVHYVEHPNSTAMRDFANQKATELYESLGAETVMTGPPPPATHNMGTCRIANNIDDGVCDKWGRTFDVPNLFISDGSQFPSSGTSNPTLTIVMLALRQAAYLKRQLKSKAI